VKRVVLLKSAATALRKHRNVAPLIREKIDAYAADPASLANNVTELRGASLKRLRIGDFRVLFDETATEIVVTKIGPRGSIYD
jgi:mRNA interferase RelE/StbE